MMTIADSTADSYIVRVASLYIVATPIGNLRDITLRALETLSSVDLIAAEDTRTTRKLLSAHGISKRTISCNSHSEASTSAKLIDALSDGHDVAYVTDAGTPGLSDPGRILVGRTREAGYDVVPIPGVSALTTLLSVASNWKKPVFLMK